VSKDVSLAIDVYGVPSGPLGWTTHSVEFARALNTLTQVRFRGKRKALWQALVRNRDRAIYWRGLREPPAPFGVIVTGRPTPNQPSARWIVWETTLLPPAVRATCDAATYIWAPSTWGYRNLAANGIAPARLAVVPEGVDIDFFRPRSGPKSGPFRFLFVGKWETRKFIDGLARAFAAEFRPSEPVELVLHAHNPYIPDFSVRSELKRLGVPDAARIRSSGQASKASLRDLYQSADCFVCPTRAEGWGLPILEAMACGVPPIVTRYSAPLDFVNDDNGYLLNVSRMVDAHCDIFNIHTGQWAEPDAAHLRQLMREAVQDAAARRAKADAALKEAQRWSWRHAAEVALRTIKSHLND